MLLNYWAIIDATDSRGQTALFKAAEGGYFEAIQLLALRGANVNVVVEDRDTENINIHGRRRFTKLYKILRIVRLHKHILLGKY